MLGGRRWTSRDRPEQSRAPVVMVVHEAGEEEECRVEHRYYVMRSIALRNMRVMGRSDA